MSYESREEKIFEEPIIEIEEPWKENLWCKILQCTKDELAAAIQKVGNSERAVRTYLKK